MQALHLFASLNAAGLPALRVVSIIAVLIFAGAGFWIYRRRHQLFERDPEMAEYQDGAGVRHIRVELVLIVWGVLMVVTLAMLYAIWSA